MIKWIKEILIFINGLIIYLDLSYVKMIIINIMLCILDLKDNIIFYNIEIGFMMINNQIKVYNLLLMIIYFVEYIVLVYI